MIEQRQDFEIGIDVGGADREAYLWQCEARLRIAEIKGDSTNAGLLGSHFSPKSYFLPLSLPNAPRWVIKSAQLVYS